MIPRVESEEFISPITWMDLLLWSESAVLWPSAVTVKLLVIQTPVTDLGSLLARNKKGSDNCRFSENWRDRLFFRQKRAVMWTSLAEYLVVTSRLASKNT